MTTIRAQLVSIFCDDHAALAKFYGAAFGFAEITRVASPIFTALDAGGVALGFHADDAYGLLGVEDRRGSRGATHVTFELGSPAAVDASVERLTALGATVIRGPFDTYYGAHQVVFADPEGNLLRVTDQTMGPSVDGT